MINLFRRLFALKFDTPRTHDQLASVIFSAQKSPPTLGPPTFHPVKLKILWQHYLGRMIGCSPFPKSLPPTISAGSVAKGMAFAKVLLDRITAEQ